MKRTVQARVEEFAKKKPRQADMSYDEAAEILDMFGLGKYACEKEPLDIIKTAFLFGYLKCQNTQKRGRQNGR